MPVNFLENNENEEEPFLERTDVRAYSGILLIIFFFFLLATESTPQQNIKWIENFKEEEVIGRVNHKGIDSSNHYEEYYKVGKKMYITFSPVFDKLDVGDSVYKQKNNFEFRIIKPDTVITFNSLDLENYLESDYYKSTH